jgi:hypothetical protein
LNKSMSHVSSLAGYVRLGLVETNKIGLATKRKECSFHVHDYTIDRIDLAAAQVRQLAGKKTDESFPSNQFCAGT